MVLVQRLTSPSNSLLKAVRKALAQGTTTEDGYCVAETFHLLEEALRSGCELKAVLAAESVRDEVERMLTVGRAPRPVGARIAVLPDFLMDQISATQTSQGVVALVRPPAWKQEDLIRGNPLLVIVDGVQDPGNTGAILRAAEAFGATGVMFLRGSANPHNPKAIRASTGSVFRIPLVAGLDHVDLPVALYAAVPSGGCAASRVDFARACAIVIGGEGRGLKRDLWAAATPVSIPTRNVESLNAAMAAGILLYEARRQRGSS